MTKQIIVNIPLTGIAQGKANITIETQGYSGSECVKDVEALTSAINAEKIDNSEEYKDEFYAQNHIRQTSTGA